MYALLILALAYSASAQLPENCGTPVVQPTLAGSRIVSQTPAIPHSWPWQTQVRYNGGHFCGASVISNGYLVSAAHCFHRRPASSFAFRAGRQNSTGTESTEQTSTASAIFVHEDYNPNTINNDVAVIRLQTPYTFNNNVQPACLADKEPEAGSEAYVTGWGNVQGTCCVNQLKQALLPVIDREECQKLWGLNIRITDGMVCAGDGYPSACNGDSGGPLVQLTSSTPGALKFTQVGIVSWGPNGCQSSFLPSGYTNVAKYRPWIVSKLALIEREEELVPYKFHPRMGAAFRAESVVFY